MFLSYYCFFGIKLLIVSEFTVEYVFIETEGRGGAEGQGVLNRLCAGRGVLSGA